MGPAHRREHRPEFTRTIPFQQGRLFPTGEALGQVFQASKAVPAWGALTCEEADAPEAGVQGHLDLCALVLGQDHAFLQVQPVVGADRNAQETQATHSKDTAQQGQGLPPAGAHLPRNCWAASGQGPASRKWALEAERGWAGGSHHGSEEAGMRDLQEGTKASPLRRGTGAPGSVS